MSGCGEKIETKWRKEIHTIIEYLLVKIAERDGG